MKQICKDIGGGKGRGNIQEKKKRYKEIKKT